MPAFLITLLLGKWNFLLFPHIPTEVLHGGTEKVRKPALLFCFVLRDCSGMFEENVGLCTATPCLDRLGSASCNVFPSLLPPGVYLLSVLCLQARSGRWWHLCSWHSGSRWPLPRAGRHPLLTVDIRVRRNVSAIVLASIGPPSGWGRGHRQ